LEELKVDNGTKGNSEPEIGTEINIQNAAEKQRKYKNVL
jgi:hypothetical protein